MVSSSAFSLLPVVNPTPQLALPYLILETWVAWGVIWVILPLTLTQLKADALLQGFFCSDSRHYTQDIIWWASTFSFTVRLLRWSMVKFNNLSQPSLCSETTPPQSINSSYPSVWISLYAPSLLSCLSIPRSYTFWSSQVSKSISIRSRNAFQVTGAAVATQSTGDERVELPRHESESCGLPLT